MSTRALYMGKIITKTEEGYMVDGEFYETFDEACQAAATE